MLSILIGIALDKFFKLNLWDFYNLTFWFESLALWAFGVSWMLKGRFLDKLLLDARETQNKT
jgi:hypothetical protein